MQALSKLMGNAKLGPRQDLGIQPAPHGAQFAPAQEELTSWELVSSETTEDVAALSEGSDTEMSGHETAAPHEMTEKKQSKDVEMAKTGAHTGDGDGKYLFDGVPPERPEQVVERAAMLLLDERLRRDSERKKKAVSELLTICRAVARTISQDELPPDFARPFVCPLGALDPKTCRPTVKLYNLAQVVEHLGRKHAAPQHYCRVCWETFDSAQARDAHARLRNCRVQEKPVTFGPTPEELDKMKQIAARHGSKLTANHNMRSIRARLVANKLRQRIPLPVPCPPAAHDAGAGEAETADYRKIYSTFHPGTLPPASCVVDDETVRMALAAHKVSPRRVTVRKCVEPSKIGAMAPKSTESPFPHPDALADKILEEDKWPRDKEKFEAEAKVKAGRKVPYNNEWIVR